MTSYMEMIFIDSDDQARKTNVGAMMDTPAETWAAFNSARQMAVGYDRAEFLLDYYNRRGELADTIPLDRRGFELISGEKARDDAYYRRVDLEYWRKAREAHARDHHQPEGRA